MLYRVERLAWALALLLACSDRTAPPPGAGRARAPRDAGGDGGASPAPPSPRPSDGPRLPEADEEIELPYGSPVQRRTIEIEATPGTLDLVFNVDTTASMGGEIDELQRSLISEVAPSLRQRVPDVSFAVARFEDFPFAPYGSSAAETQYRRDEPFRLLTPITSDEVAVTTALASLDQPLGLGGDVAESGAEALFQIATGEGYELDGDELIAPWDERAAVGGGTEAGVGFRALSLRAVLHVTDAPSHAPRDYDATFPDTHDLDQAAAALEARNVKVLGIMSTLCDPEARPAECDDDMQRGARAQLVQLAQATGAVVPSADGSCPHGVDGSPIDAVDDACPLVFDVASTGAGLSTTLVDAVASLVGATRFAVVTATASSDPIGFVSAVVPVQTDDGPRVADLAPEDAPDGVPDSFVDPRGDQALVFELRLRNLAVPARDFDQRFRVVIEVLGDGLLLRRRTLRVLVPRADSLLPEGGVLADLDAGG